jgi:dephospho-CoA kinase
MGKSTAAKILSDRGIPVVDTDELARQLVQPGQPALTEIKQAFGADMLSAKGELRRDELARQIFADAIARKKLEAILHPRIRAAWREQLAVWRTAGKTAAVVVIPLLFETGAETCFDETICIACSAPTQRSRLLARGWTPEQIVQRNAAQWPLEKKMALAHRIIWTEGGLAALGEQLSRIIP